MGGWAVGNFSVGKFPDLAKARPHTDVVLQARSVGRKAANLQSPNSEHLQ